MALLLGLAGIFISREQNKDLTTEEVRAKFNCNRITTDARQTDVFCGNPTFYNNPESVSYDDFYTYQACNERLKNTPPAESTKTNDLAGYQAYYDCKDPAKLEQLRQLLVKDLLRLKSQE